MYRPIVFALVAFLLVGCATPIPAPQDPLAQIVEDEIAQKQIPGAVVLVGSGDRILYRRAIGNRAIEPGQIAMTPGTVFDIASLTKVVVTTTLTMQLVEAGKLRLDEKVAQVWPQFAANGKAGITIEQLLRHTSGLPSGVERKTDWHGYQAALQRVVATRPTDPPGTLFRYSDVNFLTLGEVVRRVGAAPLDRQAQTKIFAPLGMRETRYLPPDSWHSFIAPTTRETPTGVVHDPTAARMGGVAGQAGLFSTADDLARFVQALLLGSPILKPATVERMTRIEAGPNGTRRALGWDSVSPFDAGMGAAFGPASYGHTGYTGTAIWVDPVRRRYMIVLANRVHPEDRGSVRNLRQHLAEKISAMSDKDLVAAGE
ncbi:serine hydrolase domain-containing protein [Roseiterribacter gracilis]|uniref:Esterase n=1 Tax=Roseiterribacter gracilis TaxID=2812848 RepID=A0A8S8X679_9PROT|nr:esterase [Rhodospirillales bacterium TMPK1]